MKVDLMTRPVRKGDVLGIEGGEYIVSLGEELYALSPAAFYIWRMCNGRSINELIDSASQELGIPREELEDLFVNVISRLAEFGLVEFKSD